MRINSQPSPRLLVPNGYKTRVREAFDRRSSVYDLNNDFHVHLAPKLIELAQIKPKETVLDAACGTGIVTIVAAEAVGLDGHVTGVDLSAEMLQKAIEKTSAIGFTNNTSFICADLDQVTFPPCSFDAILCSSSLVFLPDIPQTLATWKNWLKPATGRVVFNAPQGHATLAFPLYAKLAQEKLGLPFIEDPSQQFSDPSKAIALLNNAGYSKVDVEQTIEGATRKGSEIGGWADSMWAQCSASPFSPLNIMVPDDDVVAEFKQVCLEEFRQLAEQFLITDGDGKEERLVRETHTMLWILARP